MGKYKIQKQNKGQGHSYRKFDLGDCCSQGLWGMYKRSEPMERLHSVQKHMANVYLPLQFKEVEMFREHTM